MKDTDKRTIAIFDSLEQVEEAINVLTEAGIKRRKISVVTQSLETKTKIHGYVTRGDAVREGATTGAWTGGLFGLLIGAAFITEEVEQAMHILERQGGEVGMHAL